MYKIREAIRNNQFKEFAVSFLSQYRT